MQGCYKINIGCNQQFIFCKHCGIHFSFGLCRGYAPHFLGFTFYRPTFFGISVLLLGTMGIVTLPPTEWENKKSISTTLTVIENNTFGAGTVKKKYFKKSLAFVFCTNRYDNNIILSSSQSE